MSEMRTIEIDFDVHKRIELERASFAETPNAVLRRLLQINGTASAVTIQPTSGRAWSSENVTLPHGTELRMEYNGRVYKGSLDDGRWLVDGKEFNSPSSAAGVALTKDGRYSNLNGWMYWQVKRPGDTDWISLKQLKSMT